jgi:hypothetical protein
MTLKMKEIRSFRTAINIYQSECPRVPADLDPQLLRKGADVAVGDGMEFSLLPLSQETVVIAEVVEEKMCLV